MTGETLLSCLESSLSEHQTAWCALVHHPYAIYAKFIIYPVNQCRYDMFNDNLRSARRGECRGCFFLNSTQPMGLSISRSKHVEETIAKQDL